MLIKLIKNHVLTNQVFALVLIIGFVTYQWLPREQDPTVNFNWIQLTTIFQGASAEDVEKKVTNVLEEVIEHVRDIKFVSSTSREGVSSILVRFHDIGDSEFDNRLADLRREIQNVEDELPAAAERPDIFEITTANAFPTATVIIYSKDDNENLRRQAKLLEKDLKRIEGVDQVQHVGLYEPELQVRFDPHKLQLIGLSPLSIANSIRAFFVDTAAGKVRIGRDEWLVRVQGTTTDPDVLAQLPIIRSAGSQHEIRLHDIAQVVRSKTKAERIVRFQGQPAVLFSVMKRERANTLALVERLKAFINAQEQHSLSRGVVITLADDQTEVTRSALQIMQTNALYGLLFVLVVTWLFLGTRISILVTIGIPFTLAGTFIVLGLLGQTLNTVVLLGIVIALGMLVDDAVVVVESIHDRLRRGRPVFEAVSAGLQEVMAPVNASVLTTMVAFLPLMLMPGVMGKFMMVVPLTVTVALAISLIEAFWMLPGHVLASKAGLEKRSKLEVLRRRYLHRLQVKYGFYLIKVLRYPKRALAGVGALFLFSILVLLTGIIKMDFFASDTLRIFYINVEMPPTSSVHTTIEKVLQVEAIVSRKLQAEEARSVVSYAGQMFTEAKSLFGEHMGQVLVSLNPQKRDGRSVEEIIEAVRADLHTVVGANNISFLKIAGGPPTSKAVSVKVRGDDYRELRAAVDALIAFIRTDDRFTDLNDDDSKGRYGLRLVLDNDAVNRAGLNPQDVYRIISMLVDGEIVSDVREQGERLLVRVKSAQAVANEFEDINALLALAVPMPNGGTIPLSGLVKTKIEQAKGNLRHYNFRRTITLESDLKKDEIDTLAANKLIADHWQKIALDYPNVSLDFSGELDDIKESIGSLGMLLLLGVALMYMVLSTQFQSYAQPLMILITVPMAFIGVILGLVVSQNPLSLFTLYGIVALVGMAVNASIVLISKANSNLKAGMSLTHANFYAARRRMLPITITVMTTIGGLFSLAIGLGGHSLMWAPVATSIVWGLLFSAGLTMFIIPVLYQASMQGRQRRP